MASRVHSIVETGGLATLVTVECHITAGLPHVVIVGFANRAVDEAKERLRAAFNASQLDLPKKRIVINLAPADIPKDSSSFDLAMAVSVLLASKQIASSSYGKQIIIGELGLNGDIRPVRGIIGKLLAAKSKGYKSFIIPSENLNQAMLVPGITLLAAPNLQIVFNHLTNHNSIKMIDTGKGRQPEPEGLSEPIDLSDISGQVRAKRVLEIAAAGGHNILFNGPPGTGKSMLAKALPSILPPMNLTETLEVTQLHSLASNNYDQIITERPFRAPHHSASEIAIIGGGSSAKPGEISLAHRGVLFLDEFPEYNRPTIEALRQPLEDKVITVARAKHNAQYSADFMLIATSNPCPCGFYGTDKTCSCQPHMILAYQRKLSGPIIDRIDLFTDVDQVNHSTLLNKKGDGQTSAEVREKVAKARQIQYDRNGGKTKTNASLSNREVKNLAKLTDEAEQLLNQAAERLQISARSYMRLIKVARTIADLDESQNIETPHISEAIQYRRVTPQ